MHAVPFFHFSDNNEMNPRTQQRLEMQAQWAEWRNKHRDLIGDARLVSIVSFVCRECHKVIRNQRDNETGYDCLPCQTKRQKENRHQAIQDFACYITTCFILYLLFLLLVPK